MAIYLVQHGKSFSKDQDPQKGLSDEGGETTRKIAKVAADYGINVSRIVHSGKKRAFQTAEIFEEYLKTGKAVADMPGLNPKDNVNEFALKVEDLEDLNDVMVVGHLPFMEKLVSRLTAGDEGITVFKFQNSGVVCLDAEDGNWFIKWALMPQIK